MPPAKNELHCPVKIVVSVSLRRESVDESSLARASSLFMCVCMFACVCIFVCKITNNLRSLRSSLIWYYYFRCSPNETLLCNSIMLKYIMAHHHPFFVFSTLRSISYSIDAALAVLLFLLAALTNIHSIWFRTQNLHALRYVYRNYTHVDCRGCCSNSSVQFFFFLYIWLCCVCFYIGC